MNVVREMLRASVIDLAERRALARPDRYTLRAWADGYVIYDRSALVCTFHGPQFELAAKTLHRLKVEDEAPSAGPQAA